MAVNTTIPGIEQKVLLLKVFYLNLINKWPAAKMQNPKNEFL